METFIFQTEVKCADADGQPICEGSVLKDIKDGTVGVVCRIIRAEDKFGPMCSCVGDLILSLGPGQSRVTNRYNQWRHVPRSEQTYQQRLQAWYMTEKSMCPISDQVSEDEAKAIDGIMALLPEDIVCWEERPWPDSIEGALQFLADHLTSKQ